MINMNEMAKMCENRKKGILSREAYWSEFKEVLENLSEFVSFQAKKEINLSTESNEIFVDMKCTQSHQCRIKMLLDPYDIRSVPFSVLADGYYEPFQSDLLVTLGKVANRFLDIGSNMGFYSLALAKENPSLIVDAFEPQPGVFKTLTRNTQINNLSERINLHNMGLGIKQTELTMYVPKFTGSGGASFKNLHEDEGAATEVKVKVQTLDSLELKDIDLIKIDVEGFELNVIMGSSKLILDSKPTIMVELLRKWMKPFDHTPQMFLEKMFQYDYKCFAIRQNDLIEIDTVNENTHETNFIFVHPEKILHIKEIINLID